MPWQIIFPFAKRTEAPSGEAPPAESPRDTFDQLLYSFVLLIAGRAFLVEPFVIPTGSMAPTLYGRHKECVCDACGFDYQIGASAEVRKGTAVMLPGSRITLSPCPNCRFPNDVKDAMAFNGDYIVVNKWAFDLGEPERFDVFVFKWPTGPQENYIKRLVGMPGETTRVRGGDLYRVVDGREEILRMDNPRKRRAASILVHDNDFPVPTLREAGFPERWAGDGWEEAGTARTLPEPPAETAWLTYTHLVPSADDWRAVADGRRPTPRPRLIADYCPYNSYTGTEYGDLSRRPGGPVPEEVDEGVLWVPDIAAEFDLDLAEVGDGAEVVLELTEGVYRYRCRIDPGAGVARLVTVNVQMDPDEERPLAEAAVPVRGGGLYALRFANFDDELALWVDGVPVDFGGAARYTRTRLDNTLPTRGDLSPIRIGLRGASGTASRLRVFRDLCYRVGRPGGGPDVNFERMLSRTLTDPAEYAAAYATAGERNLVQDIVTGPEEYLAMGDNSPQSSDSRMWSRGRQVVPESHLVGKAFFTYWPHGVPFLNNGRGFAVRPHYEPAPGGGLQKVEDYPQYVVPFYPNYQRMTRIR